MPQVINTALPLLTIVVKEVFAFSCYGQEDWVELAPAMKQLAAAVDACLPSVAARLLRLRTKAMNATVLLSKAQRLAEASANHALRSIGRS